ncbi:hypothetical protein DFH07DRAFT_144452 [Mycena maculata]|uniref:Uncharacterized protein n=1 Tax=Mycena maculata TaxID=230809 RepID=A0AAD7I0H6_9AGAR|nr:hypothetical protein DFH07DRAFT_144452 [Mycena maculata]
MSRLCRYSASARTSSNLIYTPLRPRTVLRGAPSLRARPPERVASRIIIILSILHPSSRILRHCLAHAPRTISLTYLCTTPPMSYSRFESVFCFVVRVSNLIEGFIIMNLSSPRVPSAKSRFSTSLLCDPAQDCLRERRAPRAGRHCRPSQRGRTIPTDKPIWTRALARAGHYRTRIRFGHTGFRFPGSHDVRYKDSVAKQCNETRKNIEAASYYPPTLHHHGKELTNINGR